MLEFDKTNRALAYPLQIAGGRVVASEGEQKIRESIILILGTQPGERVMRPTFGCDLRSLVFAPANAATVSLARFYVQDALTRWEPRIDVLAVVVDIRTNGGGNELRINVQYRLKSAGATDAVAFVLPLTS